MRSILASFASLAILGFLPGFFTAAQAESFVLPSGSTVSVGGAKYTITGSVAVNGSDQVTGGSFTIDGLPSLGNTTFSYTSSSILGGPLNQWDHNVYDQAYFNSVSDANGIKVYSGSLALYTLVLPSNGTLTICDGYCGTATDYATETSGVGISFAGSPYYLSGSFGGSLQPALLAAVQPAISNVSATPEPSSLALLGTGLLGVAGVARRLRWKRQSVSVQVSVDGSNRS